MLLPEFCMADNLCCADHTQVVPSSLLAGEGAQTPLVGEESKSGGVFVLSAILFNACCFMTPRSQTAESFVQELKHAHHLIS